MLSGPQIRNGKIPNTAWSQCFKQFAKVSQPKKKKKVIAMTVKQLLFNVSFSPFIKVLVTFFFFLVTEK